MNKKKMANNILEFLLDPTKFPVKQRLYFRPEENLKNEEFEKAKADAFKTYGDQKHNSDFYPSRKTEEKKQEVFSMDRNTIVASLAELAGTFKKEDPIATDLRTMSYAVSKMSDEELVARCSEKKEDEKEASESVTAKAKTFKCPKCDTKVLEQTGYCVKCRKKVKKQEGKKEAGQNEPTYFYNKGKGKSEKEAEVVEVAPEAPAKEVQSFDFWCKEASDVISRNLVAEVESPVQEQQEEHEKSETPEEEAKEHGKKEAGKEKGPGIPDGTGPLGPECQMKKEKKADEEIPIRIILKPEIMPLEKSVEPMPLPMETPIVPVPEAEEKEAKVEPVVEEMEIEKKKTKKKAEEVEAKKEEKIVNTEMLTAKVETIEMDPPIMAMEDVQGGLTEAEQNQLDQLFQ